LVLDTSAANFNNINKSQYLKIIKCHPLWLIDIKHITEQGHKYITGSEQLNELALIKLLEGEKQNYWIRQVLVPGLTDKPKDLVRLGRFLKGLKYCQRFELLPYHKLGVNKYKQLEIKYPLLKTKLPTNHDLSLAKMHINKGLK
jgi:pyruvate formate lyase activating enzyme